MLNKLRTRLILFMIGGTIFSIVLISIITNIAVFNRFDTYMEKDHISRIEDIVRDVQAAYTNDGWSEVSLENLRTYSYSNDFDIIITGNNNNIIFENYMDSSLISHHRQMMNRMGHSMSGRRYIMGRGSLRNNQDYKVQQYTLYFNDVEIGKLDIGYIGPFTISEREIEFSRGINKSIIYAAVISTIVTILLGAYFSKYISNPIQKITSVANNIRKGKLNVEIDVPNNITEIRELSLSINHLSKSLKEQQVLRNRLTSDISHELRTPLTILQSHIEAISDGVWEATPEKLGIFRSEVNRLIKLVEQLKYLTDIENHDISLDIEELNVSKLIDDVAESFKLEIENKNITLLRDIEQDVLIKGDYDKLKQVMINLLSNALKFTNAKGKIDVSLCQKNNMVQIQVHDTGIGISEEDIAYIFERLYRSDKSRSRKTGGVGIGLTITKKLIEAHKGTIKVESKENIGTKFIIELPKNYFSS